MINIHRTTKYRTEDIPIDPFWNVGEEKEQRMHRIHAYPAKFPAFITTKALQFAKSHGVIVERMADVFCGCGTVAYEAKRNEIAFWGCDINPIATMIAKAKSQSYQTWRLMDYFDRIVAVYRSRDARIPPYVEAQQRLRYWFDSKSYRDLSRLRSAIDASVPPSSKYHTFFLVAFSNILKSTSRWLTKSIKPQVDPDKRVRGVLAAFKSQCEFAIMANEDSDVEHNTSVAIKTANFLSHRLSRPTVDMIVTSPPYVTSYEYADLHQLSALWLRPNIDYRDLRSGSIGTLHHDSNFQKNVKALNEVGRSTVNSLRKVDASKARSVAKYFVDMQAVAKESFLMLSPGGMALFVIGNTKYSGVKIDNARHLVEAMFAAGFQSISMSKRKIKTKILTPYRDRAGRFTSDGRGRKVYSEEFIVVGRAMRG